MKKMTREEFNAACIESGGYSHKNKFEVEWCTGGTSGGYDGSTHAVSPEAPQELESLDVFLEKHFSDIKFMQYKAVTRVVKTEDYSESDWYGGETYHIRKSISFEDLARVLNTLGLLLIINPEVI